eukprot:3772628-Amphidinium_carterae.1
MACLVAASSSKVSAALRDQVATTRLTSCALSNLGHVFLNYAKLSPRSDPIQQEEEDKTYCLVVVFGGALSMQ